jgi:hypothetical protein
LAAGGPITFVATKVTKMLFSFKASLPHKASAPQIRHNHGLQTVAPLRSLKAAASANICYAPATAQGHQVLPDFARSELQERDKRLWEQRQNLNMQIKKRVKA